jgi:hypothetical protein
MTHVLGVAIVVAVFAGFFWVTASIGGWRLAAAVWGGSLIITAVLILGVALAVGIAS